jgi:hypothetical protein
MPQNPTIIYDPSSVRAIFIGGALFWAPSVLLHAIYKKDWGELDTWLLTIVLPTTLFLIVAICSRLKLTALARRSVSGCLALGIWLMYPICVSMIATTAGQGMATLEGCVGLMIGMMGFPLTTLMGTMMDGSLLAVVITTSGLLMRRGRERSFKVANV